MSIAISRSGVARTVSQPQNLTNLELTLSGRPAKNPYWRALFERFPDLFLRDIPCRDYRCMREDRCRCRSRLGGRFRRNPSPLSRVLYSANDALVMVVEVDDEVEKKPKVTKRTRPPMVHFVDVNVALALAAPKGTRSLYIWYSPVLTAFLS